MAEYAFVHIPKNAGTSVSKIINDIPQIDFFSHWVRKETIKDHKKIFIIREPINRFTSAFFYLKGYKKNKERNFFQTPEELLQALRNLDKRALEFMKVHDGFHFVNGQKILTDWVFHKQSAWVHDPWKIIMYHKLHEGIQELNDLLHIRIELPHANKSKKIDFEYSKDSLDLLKILYREDFELFEKYNVDY